MATAWEEILWGPIARVPGNGYVYRPPAGQEASGAIEEAVQSMPNNNNGGDGGNNYAGTPGFNQDTGLYDQTNFNYTDPEWWGGLGFSPNLKTTDILQSIGPLAAAIVRNPFQGILAGMTLDPIKDPALRKSVEEYATSVGISNFDWQDFVSEYKDLVKQDPLAAAYPEATIQGMAIGRNPALEESYRSAIAAGQMSPTQLGQWADTLARSGMGINDIQAFGQVNPTLGLTSNPAYDFAKNYFGIHSVGWTPGHADTMASLNAGAYMNRDTSRLDAITGAYGYGTYDDWANSVRNGTTPNGGGWDGLGSGLGSWDSGWEHDRDSPAPAGQADWGDTWDGGGTGGSDNSGGGGYNETGEHGGYDGAGTDSDPGNNGRENR